METLEKTTAYKGWAGILAFSIKDNQKYICLVQDRTGLWGFPGGKIEDEKTQIAAIREALEETSERIFTHQLKPVWNGHSSELNIEDYESHFYVYRTNIPFFNHRKIENDSGIIKAQNFMISFFTNVIMHNLNGYRLRRKDLKLANKLGKKFFWES